MPGLYKGPMPPVFENPYPASFSQFAASNAK